MRPVWRAEAIGLGHARAAETMAARAPEPLRRELLGARGPVDPINRPPWLAEITALHPRWRYERRFLAARIDRSQASSTGNRGVWYEWQLEPGRAYQAEYRTSWGSGYKRVFLGVDETSDQVVEIPEQDVRDWLERRPRR
jgi:hypothetical protein